MWLHSNSVLDPHLVYFGKFSIQVFRVSVQRRWAILEKKESCSRLLPLSTRYSDVFCDLIMTNWQKFKRPSFQSEIRRHSNLTQSFNHRRWIIFCADAALKEKTKMKKEQFLNLRLNGQLSFFSVSLSLHLFSKHCQNLWLIGVIIQALHSWTIWGGLKWFGNRLNKNSLMFPREGLALFHLIWVFFWP